MKAYNPLDHDAEKRAEWVYHYLLLHFGSRQLERLWAGKPQNVGPLSVEDENAERQ